MKTQKQAVKESYKELLKYHSGDIKPLVTGLDYFDDIIGGVYPGDFITIAAPSGVGKTHLLNRLIDNFYSIPQNSWAQITTLHYSWEMRNLFTLVRKLSEALHKPKKDVILQGFNEGEERIAADVCRRLINQDIFLEEDTKTPEQVEQQVREFLEERKDKHFVIITFDHSALIDVSSRSEKGSIDDLIKRLNKIRKEYKNCVFLILSQMNRTLDARLVPRTNEAIPMRNDLYGTDFLFHISDVVIALERPARKGVKEYMKFKEDTYPHLQKYFTSGSLSEWRSFKTKGLLFFFYIKLREGQSDDNNLHIEELTTTDGRSLFEMYNEIKPEHDDDFEF